MSLKNMVFPTLKIITAGALITWLWQKGFLNISQIKESLTLGYFFIGALICLGTILVNNLRWLFLVRAVSLNNSFFALLKLTFLGLFFNHALPGGVGGDVVKGYYLVKGKKEARTTALMTIVMDRLVGFWAMAFMALCSLLLKWEFLQTSQPFQLMAFGVLLVFLIFTFLFIVARLVPPEVISSKIKFFIKSEQSVLGKLAQLFMKSYGVFSFYAKKPKTILLTFLASIVSQSLSVFFMILVGQMLGFSLDNISYFFAVPLGFIASAIPIAPAGIGVGQTVLFYLFNLLLEEQTTLGPNVMTAFQIMLFLFSLMGAYQYVFGLKYKGKEDPELETVDA